MSRKGFMNKKISKVLFPIMLWMIPITAGVYAYGLSVHGLADYIYKQTTAPFLQNGVIVTHSQSKLTMITKPLQIEYQVLKVNNKPVKK